MMNLADPLFLIISPSPIMSSRTVKLRPSLSLSLPSAGLFSSLNILNFPPLFARRLIPVFLSFLVHLGRAHLSFLF